MWIDTIDNDAQQTTACYSLDARGALDSPFYQAIDPPLQPSKTVLTAIDVGKISQLDAPLAEAASNDARYPKLEDTNNLERQNGLMFSESNGQRRSYVPDKPTIRNLILMITDDLPYARHLGVCKTTELLTQ